MPKPRSLRLSLTLFSLLLTGLIALAIAFSFRNDAARYYYLQKLRSTDAAVRIYGLAYVYRHAPADPALRAGLHDLLLDPATDDQLRADLIRVLRLVDVWGPSFNKPWLNWLTQIATADGKLPNEPPAPAGVRIGITFQLIRAAFDRQPIIADPGTSALLQTLAGDENPDVRYWAVRASASLPATSRAPILDIALHDTEPVIVRHARIIDALSRDQSPTPPDTDFADLYSADPAQLADVYRNAPATSAGDARAAFAASRLAPQLGSNPLADVLLPVTWSQREHHSLRELAILENLPPRSIDITIDEFWPPLVRVAAAHAAKNIDDDTWLHLFEADESSVRILACFLAIDRLSQPQLRDLISKLNRTFYDNKRIAGALLIALTGLETPTLDSRLQREHVWFVRQHLQLAKWMLHPDTPDFNIDSLLTNSAFPRDILYLALLRAGRFDALDMIFQPFTPDAGQLRDLLNNQRFLPVLQRYLAAGQPPFDLYADPPIQLFQSDVLRNWYLMHRADLRFDATRSQFVVQPEMATRSQ